MWTRVLYMETIHRGQSLVPVLERVPMAQRQEREIATILLRN